MAITSAQIKIAVAATAVDTFAVTTQTGKTSNSDSVVYANGTNSTCITSVVDKTITVAANSTVVTLSSLTDTLDNTFSATKLKGWRMAAPSTNAANVTVSSNVTGLWTGVMHSNTSMAMATGNSGYAVAGTNNITVAGVNSDTLTVTLFLS